MDQGSALLPVTLGEISASVSGPEAPCTLPGACYTSEQFYAYERNAVFAKCWFAVTPSSRIPQAGDSVIVDTVGEPLVAVRQPSGDVAVLSRVCQHRGALLLDGGGNCKRGIVCPYHGWRYNVDGRLTATPFMDCEAVGRNGRRDLRRLYSTEWQGFVFASFEDKPFELARSQGLERLLRNYDLPGMVGPTPERTEVSWNWKVMLENAIECYHCTKLHGRLHAIAPTRNTVASPLSSDDIASATRIRNTAVDAELSPTGEAFFPILPGLDEAERCHSTWVVLPPNLLFSLQHDNVHYYIVRPHSARQTELEVGYLYPKSTLEREDFPTLFGTLMAHMQKLVDQDFMIDRAVQKGLSSRFSPRAPIAEYEIAIAGFTNWLVNAYQASWPNIESSTLRSDSL